MTKQGAAILLLLCLLPGTALRAQEGTADADGVLDQALAAVDAGDVARALELLEPLRDQPGAPPPALALLGALYVEANRPREALEVLRGLAAADSPQPAVLYNAGRAAVLLGDEAQAERYLQRSVELAPGSPASRELGLLYGRQGRYAEALAELGPWARSRPTDLEARLAAAVCAIKLERSRDAEEMLSDLPQDQLRVRLLWGRLLLLKGDPWGALATLRPALDEAPPELGPEIRRLMAEAHLGIGQADEAVELLEELAGAGPAVALQLSMAQFQGGDPQAALETVGPWARGLTGKEPPELDPGLAAALALHYGRLLGQANRHQAALPYLELATRSKPGDKEGWQLLGQTLAVLGRRSEAEAALERFRRLSEREAARSPGDLELRQELEDPTRKTIRAAMELVEEGRLDDALELVRQERALAPGDLRPLLLEGQLLQQLERLPEALEIAGQAVEAAPDNADAVYLRGAIRMGMGEMEAAETDLRRALALASTHRAAMNDLAVLLIEKGDTAEARRLLEQVLALDPDDPVARANLEWLEKP